MISVIIPVYNVEDYLEKCIRSVLTNTYQDLEVICINDGSTDGCLEILQRMQAQDSRIKIINQENRGLPAVRTRGLKAASGEYIAFIDSDDWIHPQYFETLLNCMEKTGADMAVCGCCKFEPEEQINVAPIPKIHYSRLSADEFCRSYYARHMVWARLIRKKDAENLDFPKEVRPTDDTLFNLRLIASFPDPKIYQTEEKLYYYLQRPGSLIRTYPYDQFIDMPEWYLKEKRASERLMQGKWSWILLIQSIKLALSCRYEANLRQNNELARHANNLLYKMMREMCRSRSIHIEKKIAYSLMFFIPELYRLFRLLTDPTMKIHEKSLKK